MDVNKAPLFQSLKLILHSKSTPPLFRHIKAFNIRCSKNPEMLGFLEQNSWKRTWWNSKIKQTNRDAGKKKLHFKPQTFSLKIQKYRERKTQTPKNTFLFLSLSLSGLRKEWGSPIVGSQSTWKRGRRALAPLWKGSFLGAARLNAAW